MPFPAENIRDWSGHDVVDVSGSKIGTLESVYFDTNTDEAAFAAIKIGIIGRHRLAMAPLGGAVVTPDHIKLTVDKKLVKDALAIDTDGELTSDQEPELFAYYNLVYQPGASGERRLGRH